jgi:transposase
MKKHVVALTADERRALESLLRAGTAPALKLTRARVLLKADAGDHGPAWPDERIAEALEVGVATVARIRRRFAARGLAALERKPQDRPSRRRTLDGAAEARLIALACSGPPGGRVCWTMQLLADRLVELRVVDAVSDETVRRALKKTR